MKGHQFDGPFFLVTIMDKQFNSDVHHRRTFRLPGYDYSANGYYHVVICAHLREFLFGEIINNEMHLVDLGLIVQQEWLRTPEIRKNVMLDEYIIMPNYLHGILIIDN